MEKILGVTPNQSYVNKVMAILNCGLIPPVNSDILHWLILWNTIVGEEIQNSKIQNWDGICKQCSKVIETMSNIFEC